MLSTQSPEGVRVQDLIDDNNFGRTAHYVKESYRQLHYDLFRQSGRHEVKGQKHDNDPQRRKMATWAGNDSVA